MQTRLHRVLFITETVYPCRENVTRYGINMNEFFSESGVLNELSLRNLALNFEILLILIIKISKHYRKETPFSLSHKFSYLCVSHLFQVTDSKPQL